MHKSSRRAEPIPGTSSAVTENNPLLEQIKASVAILSSRRASENCTIASLTPEFFLFMRIVLSGAVSAVLSGFLIITFLESVPPSEAGGKGFSAEKGEVSRDLDDCVDLPFRYLVVDSYRATPNSTRVELFIENIAFSETNLKLLFNHFSRTYIETPNLTVVVFTDWNQLTLPSECLRGAISESAGVVEQNKFHEAVFYRREGEKRRSYFRFNPNLRDYKTVRMDFVQ